MIVIIDKICTNKKKIINMICIKKNSLYIKKKIKYILHKSIDTHLVWCKARPSGASKTYSYLITFSRWVNPRGKKWSKADHVR